MSLMFQADFDVSTPNDFQILRSDPIVDAGTIMLWDPTRSGLSAFPNGAVIPETAIDVAPALLGVDKSLLGSTLAVPAFPTEFLTERTAKGGLHIMVTQNTLGGNNRRLNLPFSNPVKTYIDSHAANTFYVSFWGMFTRLPTVERTFFQFGASSYAANNYFYMRSPGTSGPLAGAVHTPSSAPAVGVPFLYTVAFTGKTGSFDPSAASTWTGLFQGAFSTAGNGYGSLIMYKASIHDLTVAQISAADKRVSDLALFNKAFADGGRLKGDTYTAPTI